MSNRTRIVLSATLVLLALLLHFGVSRTTAESATLAPTFTCDDVTEIPAAECQALADLFNSTDGATWAIDDGWLATTTPCSWFGVACQAGHVAALALAQNGLKGPLPASLGDLSQLRELKLQRNELNGSIPDRLGDLSNLVRLDLSDNQLSGAIPAGLGDLSNLQVLDLWDNQLSGAADGWAVPPELGNLDNLETLRLTSNRLQGSIPPQLGTLSSLLELNLSNNQISGAIPPELGALASLSRLLLGQNELSGAIPAELGQMSNLTELVLARNQLAGPIPAQLGQMKALTKLDLRTNHLSDWIPAELGNLTNLTEMQLNNNRLSGPLPASLGNLTNLWELHLGSNQLSGVLPDAMCSLVGYTDILLEYNMFSAGASCFNALWSPWQNSQTIAPANLQATAVNSTTVDAAWTPILYTQDGGYYEVSYSRWQTGGYQVAGVTLDKSQGSFTITGLSSGTRYYVRVRTSTPAHSFGSVIQQNDLWSDYGQPVAVTTPGAPPVLTWSHLPLLFIQAP